MEADSARAAGESLPPWGGHSQLATCALGLESGRSGGPRAKVGLCGTHSWAVTVGGTSLHERSLAEKLEPEPQLMRAPSTSSGKQIRSNLGSAPAKHELFCLKCFVIRKRWLCYLFLILSWKLCECKDRVKTEQRGNCVLLLFPYFYSPSSSSLQFVDTHTQTLVA
jgi:hypothetical protein